MKTHGPSSIIMAAKESVLSDAPCLPVSVANDISVSIIAALTADGGKAAKSTYAHTVAIMSIVKGMRLRHGQIIPNKAHIIPKCSPERANTWAAPACE